MADNGGKPLGATTDRPRTLRASSQPPFPRAEKDLVTERQGLELASQSGAMGWHQHNHGVDVPKYVPVGITGGPRKHDHSLHGTRNSALPPVAANPKITLRINDRSDEFQNVSGVFEVKVHVTGAKGLHLQVYNDMNPLWGEHIDSDDWTKTFQFDPASLEVAHEHLLNVHVHRHADNWEEFDPRFGFAKLRYNVPDELRESSAADVHAPRIKPSSGALDYKIVDHPEFGPVLEYLHQGVADDQGVAQMFPHIGTAILPRANRVALSGGYENIGPYGKFRTLNFGGAQSIKNLTLDEWRSKYGASARWPQDSARHPNYVARNVILRPFLSEQAERSVDIVNFASDSVGRADIATSLTMKLPRARGPMPQLPTAELLSIKEGDSVTIPPPSGGLLGISFTPRTTHVRVAVHLPQAGQYSPRDREFMMLRLWGGEAVLGTVDLVELALRNPGKEVVEVDVPVSLNQPAENCPRNFLGHGFKDELTTCEEVPEASPTAEDVNVGMANLAATAMPVWMEFLVRGKNASGEDDVFGLPNPPHTHVRSLAHESFKKHSTKSEQDTFGENALQGLTFVNAAQQQVTVQARPGMYLELERSEGAPPILIRFHSLTGNFIVSESGHYHSLRDVKGIRVIVPD